MFEPLFTQGEEAEWGEPLADIFLGWLICRDTVTLWRASGPSPSPFDENSIATPLSIAAARTKWRHSVSLRISRRAAKGG